MDVAKVIIMILFFVTAGFLIGLPIFTRNRIKRCTIQIMAEYIRYNSYSGGKGQRSYAPVFRYTYKDIVYEEQTPISFSYKKLEKMYQIGSSYSIWIDEKKPKRCINQQKVPFSQHIIALFGIFMLAMSVLAVLDYVQLI